MPGEDLWISVPCGLELNSDNSLVDKPTIVSDFILSSQKIEYEADIKADATSIDETTVAKETNQGTVYDISGKRVGKHLNGGMIIKDKRKFVVKKL